DAQRAALERDDAVAELESTARAGHSVARELARWVGMPPDSLPEVSAPGDDTLETPGAADSLAVLARYGAAPEIARAKLAVERSRLDLALAKRRRETQVGLALDAGLWGSDLTSSIPEELRATD